MKKRIVSSFIGLSLFTDFAQAHQFSKTDIEALGGISSKKVQTIMIEAASPLSEADKEILYDAGIENIVYAGALGYYIYGDTSHLENALNSIDKIKSISAILPSSKVSSTVQNHQDTLSDFAYGAPIEFTILLIKEMNQDALSRYLQEAGIDATVYDVMPSLKSAKIKISSDAYEKVKSLPLIQYMDKSHTLGVNETKKSRNLKSATYENITKLWSDTYHLNGEGMSVAVVDGGLVRNTHQEFVNGGVSSVVLENTISSYADHATHVAGTIIADGDNQKARGVANQATLYSYTFLDSAFADKTVTIYQKDGVLFSNHSYGYSDMTKLGEYDSEAAKQDRAVAGNPYLNIFEAAGNDGEEAGYPAYGKIKGPGNSKNILTIGALNINASGVAKFSSNGPTRDGRIKPELCARGESIYSTSSSSDDAYFWMAGTSMATPSVTGIGLLAAQAYQKVSGGYDIRHDILKACMINAAIDKGRKGPDFDSGFGMVDAKATIDTINSLSSNKPLVYADSVSHQERKELHFQMVEAGHFKATISWIDPEASPTSAQALVNDIDMWLENSAGKKFYPYTLDGAHPTALAVQTKLNHVDNNEQVEVANLPAGAYTLVIKGGLIVTKSQEFALASNVSVSSESHIATVQPSQLHNFAKVIQGAIY